MSENTKGYGRDGDLDSEISEILAQYEQNNREENFGKNDLGEMASRYGIDVSNPSFSLSAEKNPSYPSGHAQPQPIYDENGGRIVYDADTPVQTPPPNYTPYGYGYPQGYTQAAPAGQMGTNRIPSYAERRKKQAVKEPEGVKVIYDAETSSKAASEAPFENIGNTQEIKVSDGREKTDAERKKEKKLPGEMSKGRKIFKVFIPWNGDSKKEKIRKIIMDVSFFILLICAIYFVNYFVELYDAKQITNLVRPNTEQTDANSEKDAWDEIKKKYPDVNFPEGMNIKYADLYAKNQDFVGWLSIENTNIDIPIVKGEDNSFYLKHDFLKRDTKYGNAFMDYRNNVDTLDHNTIIHGHHMKDNMLFAQLENYMTLDGFKKSPVITFNTLFHDYQWKVYAVFVTNDNVDDDNGYMFNYIVPNFHTMNSYASYIEALNVRRLYDTGVDLNTDDHMLTLSTCSYEFDGARLVVVARMVREGESAEVDVSKAKMNENPRYPQKWYDVNHKENPYEDAFNWKPNE